MKNQFILSFGPGAKVTFHSRQFDDSKWLESYVIDVEAHDFRACAKVCNPGYGHPPSQLFHKLAAQWAGWKGAESWHSMEGELEIEATTDATGHVKLEFKLPGYGTPPCWRASAWVFVEAGQLERIAEDADSFFNPKS